MRLLYLKSIVIYVYSPASIPLLEYLSPTGQNRLLGLNFQNSEWDHQTNTLNLRNGSTHLNEKLVAIEQVEISPTKIAVKLHSTTADADEVLRFLVNDFLKELDRPDQSPKPVLIAHETASHVEIDVEWTAFFSDPLLKAYKETLTKGSAGGARLVASGFSLGGPVAFASSDESLSRGSTELPKQFSLAPIAGTTPEEKKYFAISPWETDRHLEWLEGLEEALSRS